MQEPTIHGYEILSRIADGGMATVWKAKQTSLDRLVALKVLNKGLIKSEADVERFRREARAAANLRHPGLCQIYDAGETDGTVYYVMEYVAGFSLGELLTRKGDLPEKQALMIAYGIASVLGAIWTKNKVVHCDIKPDNILIDQDGTIRITDLGVARIIGTMAQNMDSDYIVGTPNYASPEQARGLEDLDCRTDMYGLGATLYHMLTGLMPFADSDGEKAMERQISDYLADPQKVNSVISNQAACLVEKLMIKDRNARYPDWNAAIRDIEEVREGRLPRGELIPQGQSTVSRSEEREEATLREVQAMKPKAAKPVFTRADSSAAAGKKVKKKPRGKGQVRYQVKRPLNTTYTASTAPGKSNWGETLQKTFYLVLLVAGTYGATFYYLWHRLAPTPEPVSPPVAEAPAPAPPIVRRATPRPAPERPAEATPAPAPRRAEPAPAAQQVPEEPAEEEVWDHRDYVEAMRLLRRADASFQRFLQARDQALLTSIEPDCRRAIELFESVRAEAPARARIGERIRQSYQLIHNTRQSRVMGQ